MKERIKKARESIGLTQSQFAKAINVSRSYVSYLECGEREPSDRTVSDIARVCSVNETWLRTGEGSMKPEKEDHYDVDSAMAEIASEIDLSQLEFNFAKAYLRLPVEERRFFERMVGSMVEEVQKMEKEDKRKKLHEELDRQLDLEKSTQEGSSGSMSG